MNEVAVRNKNNRYDRVLSVSNKYGFVSQTDYFDRVVASKNTDNYKVIKRGQFAYNPSRINVGSIALLKEYENGILSPMYIAFECSEGLYNDYLKYWFQSAAFKKQLRKYLSGSVRDSLSFKDLQSMDILLPAQEKQRKISDILISMDDLLELRNRKSELLKKHKRGLMNGLFPKNR